MAWGRGDPFSIGPLSLSGDVESLDGASTTVSCAELCFVDAVPVGGTTEVAQYWQLPCVWIVQRVTILLSELFSTTSCIRELIKRFPRCRTPNQAFGSEGRAESIPLTLCAFVNFHFEWSLLTRCWHVERGHFEWLSTPCSTR